MRHKNKTEKEVTRLYNEVVKVSMTDFTIIRKALVENNVRISLCAINAERYIPICTTPDFSYFFRRLLEKDEIPASDFIHVFHKTRVITLIKTATAEKFHDDFIGQIKNTYEVDLSEKIYELMTDKSLSVCENTISENAIRQSEEAYTKRNKLIQELARERRAEKARNNSAKDEPNTNQETLEQLVMRIEAMGWEVTLRMKPHNNNLKTM